MMSIHQFFFSLEEWKIIATSQWCSTNSRHKLPWCHGWVTAGRMLVVDVSQEAWVTWEAQDGCLGQQGLMPMAVGSGCFSFIASPVWYMCLDRGENRPCHSLILYLLWHSARECCKFLEGYWPKDEETHTVPLCTLSGFYRHLENFYSPG